MRTGAPMSACDSRTQFRIQVGQRPRALVCQYDHAGHRQQTVPFFVSACQGWGE